MAQLNSASVKSNREVFRPNPIFRLIAQRLAGSIITLLVIAYLTLVGLLLAERGRQHLPANALDALWQAAVSLVLYITKHPDVYHWNKQVIPAYELLGTILSRSIVLLVGSIGIAFFLGLALGLNAALSKRKISSGILTVLSVLGVSTPSFLLAMLFWVVNIQYYRITGNPALPSAGFGWDTHMIMPILVLAMRPMAQIAQVAYVTFSDVLRQDYIRTAEAKGLSNRVVRNRHALRNLLIPIFTTVGTSLRFSLASLPVVELFFNWPGVGSALIEAIDLGETALILDLLLSLGLFFLLVNLIIEIFFPVVDPRLREEKAEEVLEEHNSFLGWWRGIFDILRVWIRNITGRIRRNDNGEKLPSLGHIEKPAEKVDENEVMHSRRKWFVRNLLTNPALIVGCLLTIGLLVIVFFGPMFASADPYQTNGVMLIDRKVFAPPFGPSAIFPWGSDYVGRDIQSLVLNGARQTLSLAFFGMLARLLIGVTLGALAGWQRGGWLDRWMMGAVGVWAAFPITLFAMILIQGLGIQHGMWVFIVAISVVGWGEVAQFVRGQVTAIKPLSYIESARSIGARSDQIMIRHVIPNLINTLVVLAVLEMGGILMLLAELGYLNIFMGGGFRAAIGEAGAMQAVVVYFSDVPEWAALIANVRQWWRSYPWMALYPGLAFFLSILAFNLFGEGLRRFMEDSQINLSRLFNRYTFSALVGVVVILSLVLQGASPISVYRPEGMKFRPEYVLADIEALSGPSLHGRETGTPEAELSAEYIAARMKASGLLPAGEHGTFLQRTPTPRLHLTQTPMLELLDANGTPALSFAYRKEFAEVATGFAHGDVQAEVMGLAFGARIEGTQGDPYGLMNTEARDRIVIIHGSDFANVNRSAVRGILIIEDETFRVDRKDIFPAEGGLRQPRVGTPVMTIKRELAQLLLGTAGGSLGALDTMASTAPAGGVLMTKPGAKVHMSVMPDLVEDLTSEEYVNVIGVMPGTGAVEGLDSQVIMVSAYYDGLGVGTDGTIYPGANDNASGVAMLFELARLLNESSYKPEKTILFVAWAGGERNEGLSVVKIMNGRPGGNNSTVTEVIELSGVGYGSGEGIALGEDSSYRLVQLFEKVARKYNISTTTRGRGPHYGREARPGFGERKALTLSLSWDGADALAHTPGDTIDMIDPQKLYDIGRTTLLTLLFLSRETDY